MRPADAGFVYDSWLGSLADELGVDRSTGTAMRDFKRMMRPALARILEDRRTTTTVACARHDADAI
ncbi:MAG: hypothetical protein M3Q00_00650, partial [Pseudomonadota bacterium]|nr:hypothetical protein [Pseudomonadota bacterium]